MFSSQAGCSTSRTLAVLLCETGVRAPALPAFMVTEDQGQRQQWTVSLGHSRREGATLAEKGRWSLAQGPAFRLPLTPLYLAVLLNERLFWKVVGTESTRAKAG